MKKTLFIIFSAAILTVAMISACSKTLPNEPAQPAATFTAQSTGTQTASATVTETGTPENTASATPTVTITETVTGTPTATNTPIDTLYSEALLDGWVPDGGYNNTDSTIDVGDASSNSPLQGLVSFDISGITAPIAGAILRVYLTYHVNDPFAGIAAGVNAASVVPNYTTPGAMPYLVYTGCSGIGVICNSYTEGWYELNVTSAVQDAVTNGRTRAQFRLYLNGITDNDGAYDVIQFYSGDNSFNKPELKIQY